MIDLSGKAALVTGAASPAGIGFATARRLVSLGARVMLTDIAGDAVAARAAELGEFARAMPHDVTREAQWDAAIAATVSAFGGLDILVNNAGIAVLRMIGQITPEEWDRQIRVNLDSAFLGTRAAVAQMRAQRRGGAIVNMSSVAGQIGLPGCAAYAASKAGVRLFSKTVALECARENIRVNTVHPGMIWTDMQQVAIGDNKEQFDIICAAIPNGRMGSPDDIANMVAFLASDAAGYITGAEFTVDGGLTAQ